MIFKRTLDVSESEDSAISLPPRLCNGSFENNRMLYIGPAELTENHGRIRYLSLFLRNSIDEDGLMSSLPLRSILLSFEGTPLMNL